MNRITLNAEGGLLVADVSGNVPVGSMMMEDDDEMDENESGYVEWWKNDLSYLPIHAFKKQMTDYSLELNGNPSAKRVSAICDEIHSFITTEMAKEIHLEYAYSYDKDIIQWGTQTLVQTGYIECLKHIIAKLVRSYLTNKDVKVKEFVTKFFERWFSKPRYWDDNELSALENALKRM